MDEGEEARGELVKEHGDTAELLEIEEESLRKMAFLVQPSIEYSATKRALRPGELSSETGGIEQRFRCR